MPFAQHLEIRALGDDLPLGGGPYPRLRAWVRLRPAESLPPLVQLAVLADALPPASFAVLSAPVLLPTVELTLHLAGPLPAAGAWVRIQQETSWAAADVVVDDAVLHDEDGHLVARVRRLAAPSRTADSALTKPGRACPADSRSAEPAGGFVQPLPTPAR